MPPKELDTNGQIDLLRIIKMDSGRRQNASDQELVRAGNEDGERSFKDITLREWSMVCILCFVNLINYMDRFTLAGVLQDIQKYFNIGDGKTGLLQTVFILSYMIFAPLFGYLGDRYSRKYIMAGGVFLWCMTTLIGSFMSNFWWFLLFRALVGIGEASYSTIAPTIISDLFVGGMRSKMLAIFYFAIPVGSGLGYIVGSETAKLLGKWQWGLRVTPWLGLIAVCLIFFVLIDPERGQSEGADHLVATSWQEDLKDLAHNGSFVFSTAGFTCVAFTAGALAWWGPKFIYMGIKLQPQNSETTLDNISYKFGLIAMLAGITGVPLGSYIAQQMRHRFPAVDPHICAYGLIISAPLVFLSLITSTYNTTLCMLLIFSAQLSLNLTWSIVADILLYVVVPTRRSTAEGVQLLVSHAFGDAGSPFLIGLISEALQAYYDKHTDMDEERSDFQALQYSLFTTCFVEVLGGFFFLIASFFIIKDKMKVEKAVHGHPSLQVQNETSNETETSSLVS